MDGGVGRDLFFFGGPGRDELFGGAGNDSEFYGGPGDDKLYGGDGFDTNFYGAGMGSYDDGNVVLLENDPRPPPPSMPPSPPSPPPSPPSPPGLPFEGCPLQAAVTNTSEGEQWCARPPSLTPRRAALPPLKPHADRRMGGPRRPGR